MAEAWACSATAPDWADLAPVPATSVRKLPESISFEEGAALSRVGVAAYGALISASEILRKSGIKKHPGIRTAPPGSMEQYFKGYA